LSWLEIFQPPNHGRCRLLIHGLPVKLIEVQYSSNLLDWSALGTVLLTNTVRPFVDGTASSGARYYRLLELPSSSIWLDSAYRSASGFQAVVHSPPGLLLEIQGSTNLANWTALAILTNSLGAIPYTDTQTNFRARFYRARAFY